ncbi:MAG: hypothetical protein AVDCRST_MAG41-786 [uncultured Corynebacteriales bacterium]|uniref:DUF1622 domain-containing protein n=1 Tax=uncultured Mycobacteriales bacterium TaxID=581187 RepID=A0A6J4HNC3_9ACTN|nr:MAG: hypothetical protein AVDCRST_MAG41-786 [uncultured Corynebacteriales bacterium]
MTVLQFAAQVCTVLGLVTGPALLVATRAPRLALGVLLDFLLAAGLLRLAQDATVSTLLGAAAVVALRRLLAVSLTLDAGVLSRQHRGRPRRSGPEERCRG